MSKQRANITTEYLDNIFNVVFLSMHKNGRMCRNQIYIEDIFLLDMIYFLLDIRSAEVD